jgi:cytochrome c-type biogenesis protein CcmF
VTFGAPELGEALIQGSLFCAATGSVLGFWAGARRHAGAWMWARRAALGFAGLMIAANLLMVWSLLAHDFSVKYVSEVGSRATPVAFTIASLWASLNGSILFWGGILAIYTLVFIASNGHRHREYMPWTIGMVLGISVFFALLVSSVANPFDRISPVPPDGPGPNPLLQNHWLMAVHPPTLYLGYVGMVIPYSMICAALFAGRLEDGWMVPLRRWMLVPWTFLTVGIMLGGWWSYGVLGWGGYWAWDPVENASFHPWLTGTAFLHSAMVFQKRGGLRIWTLVLGMATFLLTLVGTFMTRSGVFNSVHSFTQSSIGPVFLVFIGVVLIFSVVLLALREHTLADEPSGTSMMSSVVGFEVSPLGREMSILLQNAAFTVFTFMVLLGTLFPLITEAMEGRKVSVGEPYFDRWAMPLGLMLVFLMGVGPALPWGKIAPDRLAAKLAVPAGFGLLVAAVFAGLGMTSPMVLLTVGVAGFAFWANFAELLDPVRARMDKRGESVVSATQAVLTRTRRRYGGHLAHYGVVMAVIAIAVSKGYKQEADVTLKPGEHAELGRFSVTFEKSRMDQEPHRKAVKALFAVTDGGVDVGTLDPHMNYYPTQREPIYTPAIHSTWTSDLYLSVVELDREGKYVVLRMIVMPGVLWLWIAGGVVALGALVVLWPDRRAARASLAPAAGEQPA